MKRSKYGNTPIPQLLIPLCKRFWLFFDCPVCVQLGLVIRIAHGYADDQLFIFRQTQKRFNFLSVVSDGSLETTLYTEGVGSQNQVLGKKPHIKYMSEIPLVDTVDNKETTDENE